MWYHSSVTCDIDQIVNLQIGGIGSCSVTKRSESLFLICRKTNGTHKSPNSNK